MKMREILFRGQMRKKGEKFTIGGLPLDSIWIYGGIFAASMKSDRCIITSYDDCKKYPVHADTVGQYTVLTDKNGTKIFEHDIISAHLDDLFHENETRLVVVWHDYGFFGLRTRFVECKDDGIWFVDELRKTRYESLGKYFVKNFEVIGNIYDNPELLK